MIAEDLLCQGLVMSEGQTSRVATGVWLLHELQETDDVLVIKSIAMELFQQVEGDLRLMLFNGFADCAQIASQTDGVDFVTEPLERSDHVPLCLPGKYLRWRKPVDACRWHQIFVDQHDNPQLVLWCH